MAQRIKQFHRNNYIIIAFTMTCMYSVSAQDNVKNPRNGVVNGGIVKSDKIPNQSQERTKHASGLSISSPSDILNTKTINVNGEVNMHAGKSIQIGSPTTSASIKASSSVNLNTPTIHNTGTISAGGNVNISTTNLINADSITAKSGDVNISNHRGNSLLFDNSNGSITGKTVTLKVNDSHMSAKSEEQAGSISIKGGTVSSDTISVGGKSTKVDINSDAINGKLNVPNMAAKIRLNQKTKSD